MLPKKKRFSKHKIPKAKQQAHHHASSAASSSHHSAHIPHYSATTTASVTYANTMKDYVSPAARQKKKHMDMIAATLLKLHETYFTPSSPTDATNKVSSLASILRDAGAFHAPTSTLTPSTILSLSETPPQALAKIFAESNMQSSAHLSSYLGSLDYTIFYGLFPALYDILTIPYHSILSAAPPKRGSAASRNAPVHPPVDAPPESSNPTQYKIHHLIHDYLLPLANKAQVLSSTSFALSSEVVSHPLVLHGVSKWESTLLPLFEHFAAKRDVVLQNPFTHKSTVHSASVMDRIEFYYFLLTFFPSYPRPKIDDQLLPLFDLTVSAATHLVPSSKRCSNTFHSGSLPFMGFVELLVLISLSLSPADVPNSQIVSSVYTTFDTLMLQITKQQLHATISHYSRPPTFPPLTRYLALLRDSEILDSRLGHHEAARIFIDASTPPSPVAPVPSFNQVVLKTIPILGALLPPSKSSAYVKTRLQNTFYKNHNPANQTMSDPPSSFYLPMCDAEVLQHLAKTALSPLRYVFLRYGGYISDDVEACAPSIVTSSWQTAIDKKDDLSLSLSSFFDFLSHFNVAGNSDSHISPFSINRVIQQVSSSSNPDKDINFASFLDILTAVAVTYFSDSESTSVSSLVSLFSVMDPERIMFLSPPPARPKNAPSSPGDDSTIGSNDPFNIACGRISPTRSLKEAPPANNPFDTPFCDDFGDVPTSLATEPTLINDILIPPALEKESKPFKPQTVDHEVAMRSFDESLPASLRGVLFNLYQALSSVEPQAESQPIFTTGGNGASRARSNTGGRISDGVSIRMALSFFHLSQVFASTRLTPRKLHRVIQLIESWQRILDAQDGPDTRNKVSTYHQPTKTFTQRSSTVNAGLGKSKKRKAEELQFVLSFVPFAAFATQLAMYRCSIPASSAILTNSSLVEKSLHVLQEECFPDGFDSMTPDLLSAVFSASGASEPLFHHSILSMLSHLNSQVLLSFSTGLSCDEITDPPSLKSPVLRSTTLDSIDCKLPGNVAVSLLNIVELSPPTPFDVMSAFFSVVNTTESDVMAQYGGISYSNFQLTLMEYALFVAKLSMIVSNGSVPKAVRLLDVTLHAVESLCSKTQIDDKALTLLTDEHAPIAALGGQDDELKYLYLHPPEFLRSEWNLNSLSTLSRAAGLLGNDFTFSGLLQCYEDAMGEVEGDVFKGERLLTNAWAAHLNKPTGMKVFCRFWRRVAAKWNPSISTSNAVLSFLLRKRIFPVLSGKPQIMRNVRPAVYDAMSVGLIRQHESSLEALFVRYAEGKLRSADVHMDTWGKFNSPLNVTSSNSSKSRSVWAIEGVPKDLGMTEAQWLDFAKDLNLTPNLIPLSALRSVFKESGGGCWPTFCILTLDVNPLLGVGSPLSPLNFSDFCEALLRCGMFLNLAEIDTSLETIRGAGDGGDDAEAHLDVLFRCMDSAGSIFYKSKNRFMDSPVKRGVGNATGVDELESFLELVGVEVKEENEMGMGAPKGDIVFLVENVIEAVCRLMLGDMGLGVVLDAWMVMSSGRDYLLLGEAAILVKKLAMQKGGGREDYWTEWVQAVSVAALEEKLQDEVTYEGIVCPKSGDVLDSEVWWKVGRQVERVWKCLGGEEEPLAEDVRTVLVGGVAQKFVESLASMGVVKENVIHETCGLSVAALSGSSTVSRKVGVGGVEGGLCMNRIQFEWCICRFVFLALEEMGAAGGGVAEMLDIVVELIGGKEQAEGGGGGGREMMRKRRRERRKSSSS